MTEGLEGGRSLKFRIKCETEKLEDNKEEQCPRSLRKSMFIISL